jgi:NADH-quinone oxidoreductase subunit L
MNVNEWLPWLLLLPLIGSAINGILGPRLPKGFVFFVACVPLLLGAGIAAMLLYTVASTDSKVVYDFGTWFSAGNLSVSARLSVDQLSGIMICVITGIGSLIHLYSVEYMGDDPSVHRYFSYLNLFVFSMLLLVLGDNMILMFVGWEGVGLCSYLLIGFWFTEDANASAGKKAFIVNRVGDFGVIIGTLVLFFSLGTMEFSQMPAKFAALGATGGTVALIAALFLFLGATGKSAQIPLYVWLPDAMAGPTPVSALIHAATMVTAGIYMICRLSWLYAAAPAALAVVAIIGALTALFAATMGLMQTDIKKVLAYSTVSQLGFMFLGVGVGAFSAGFFHVFTHAFFKACLFLGSGAVIYALHHEQDIRKMGGLYKKLPITTITFVISTFAIMGFPGFAGFFSKDEIMWQAFASGLEGGVFAGMPGLNYVLFALALCAATLTSFYMWRVTILTFFSGKYRGPKEVLDHAKEEPLMSLALIVLGIGAIATGYLNIPHILGGHTMLSEFLTPVVGALPEIKGDHHALEWALMAVTLVCSLGSMALAVAWFGSLSRGPTEKQLHVLQTLPGHGFVKVLYNKWYVDELYQKTIVRGLNEFSYVVLYKLVDELLIDKVMIGIFAVPAKYGGYLVRWIQNGSLQRYATVFAFGAAAVILWVVIK